MRYSIPTLVALSILTARLTAQSATNRPYFGAGIEALGMGDVYERAYGLSLQGGILRQYRALGVRFGATYFQRDRTTNYLYDHPRAIGATLELAYDLTSGRVCPYIIGGWGLYRLSGSYRNSATFRTFDQVSPAMIGGLGLRYRLGALRLFMEARAHGFTNGDDWGPALIPITVGLTF